VEWDVYFTDQFGEWWETLDEGLQESVDAKVILLQRVGPSLGRPHADVIHTSKHANMKELVIQHEGEPYRVFFAFDPNREGILLMGGAKVGDKRFYERHVPIADALFDEHLSSLRRKEKENG